MTAYTRRPVSGVLVSSTTHESARSANTMSDSRGVSSPNSETST